MLWALHVQGPDDVYAAPNWAEASEAATWLAHEMAGHRPPNADWPAVSFVVIPWPHSSESHAKDLTRWPEVYANGRAHSAGEQ